MAENGIFSQSYVTIDLTFEFDISPLLLIEII